jgi:signal transduction histidine kinase
MVDRDATAQADSPTGLDDPTEQLRRAEALALLDSAVVGIVHDLNNVLQAVRGYAELAVKRADLDAMRADVTRLHEVAESGAALTADILALTRGGCSRSADRFDVNEAVIASTRIIRGCLRNNVVLSVLPSEEPVLVCARKHQFVQVLANLGLNALDALGDSGHVSIRVSITATDEALVTVTDDGCGMDPQTAARAFEPFFTTKRRGTGLGLASARRIVVADGGSVQLETQPQVGTTVRVRLPLAAAAA